MVEHTLFTGVSTEITVQNVSLQQEYMHMAQLLASSSKKLEVLIIFDDFGGGVEQCNIRPEQDGDVLFSK